MKRRSGIAGALVIFILNFVISGFAMIVMNEIFDAASSFQQANSLHAAYDPNVILFFVDGWAAMSLVILVGGSAWLYLRATEVDST